MKRQDGSNEHLTPEPRPPRKPAAAKQQDIKKALRKAHHQLERYLEERDNDLVRANQQLKREIEERGRAEEELKRTKEYLENVIENSVDAIGIVDNQGKFILWNRRAEEIYGYQLHELAGKSAFELYANADDLDNMLARLRSEGVVREYEIPMKKKDGSIVPMDISISLLKDDHARTIGSVCVARDLSERKRAEAELKRAKDELSCYSKDLERQVKKRTKEITSILQYTPAMVYIKDSDGRYVLVNPRYEQLFGVSSEDIRGKTDFDIFPEQVARELRANDRQVFRTRRAVQIEENIPLQDGVHTYLSIIFPIHDEEDAPTRVCGIATDITELKKAQDQLRRLSGSILASQEQERTAIARELHDELGQLLTALRMDAVWLLHHLQEADPKGANHALTMCGLIDKTIDEVRSIAVRLRPSVLDDLGLIAALEWFTNDLEKRSGIACILNHENVPRVSDMVATVAYRVAQEALTNVVRHSAASHAELTLEGDGDLLTLTVVDDGRGFDTSQLSETDHLGLVGMRERASRVNGTLDIRSQPGKGTRVCCRLPVR